MLAQENLPVNVFITDGMYAISNKSKVKVSDAHRYYIKKGMYEKLLIQFLTEYNRYKKIIDAHYFCSLILVQNCIF